MTALLAWLGAAPHGFSQPTRLEGDTLLGLPDQPIAHVRVEHGPEGVVLAVAGAQTRLPLTAAPEQLVLERVDSRSRGAVVVARVSAAGGQRAAALLTRDSRGFVTIPWVGALGWRGDPGEREAVAIEMSDEDGDAQPDIAVGRVAEAVRLCGQPRTLLDVRRFDPMTGQLSSAVPVRLGPAPTVELEAKPAPDRAAPLLAGMRPRSALRAERVATDTDRELPRVLTDGDLASAWSTQPGGFVSFSWAGGRPIEAFAVVPLPLHAALRGAPAPAPARALWLLGDDGTRLRVVLPVAPEPGRRYWVEPEKPLELSCLSWVFEPPAGDPSASRPAVQLAEIEVYTDLDRTGGLTRLISELDAEDGDAAAEQLSAIGERALPELARAWPERGAMGRRRSARIASAFAGRDKHALDVLVQALAEPELQGAAVEVMLKAGTAGLARLAPSLMAPGDVGDQIALAFARRAPAEALLPLLQALAADGGSERPRLRDAIAIAARDGGPATDLTLRQFVDDEVRAPAARAALALALAPLRGRPDLTALALTVASRDCEQAQAFADRFRLVQAARDLPADAMLDRCLVARARDAERWMLRAAALESLRSRAAPEAVSIAASGLEDENPRVRAVACAILGPEPGALAALSLHARRDRWPLVRAAALDALATRSDAGAVLRGALGDPSRLVRSAALRALTRSGARDAWPLVAERLRDPSESVEVVADAVHFAEELCVAEAAPLLLDRLKQGSAMAAHAPALETALLSLHALRSLGGEAADAATAVASAPGAAIPIQSALRVARSPQAPCTPPPVTP